METLPLDELWRETRTNMSHRDEEEWEVCQRLVKEEEELQTAVKKRCLKTVERYMEMGYAFAFDPGSSLVLASKEKDSRFLEALLDGFRCHNCEEHALKAACKAGLPKNVRMLLDMQGSMPGIRGGLSSAVRGGNLECVRILWMYTGIMRRGEQREALRVAIKREWIECVEFFLEHGISDGSDAPFARVARDGERTPTPLLFVAVRTGNRHLMKLLSAYDAPRTQERNPKTVEEVAKRRGFLENRRWLKATRSWTELHHVEQLTEEHARKLLRRGYDVFVQDRKGVTPVDRAEKVLSAKKKKGAAAAKLILKAAQPWSPATHDLFPERARADAVKALLLGYAFQRSTRFSLPIDVWCLHVMPHLVARRRGNRLLPTTAPAASTETCSPT